MKGVVGELRARLDQMLTVVEDEEQGLRAKVVPQRIQAGPALLILDAQPCHYGIDEKRPIAEGSQLDDQSAARRRARRVLPVPPAPVNVRSRFVDSRPLSSSSSRSRPMKLVSWIGRLLAESRHEHVTDGLEDEPVVVLDGGANDLAVPGLGS
jgi:hypothetical protein